MERGGRPGIHWCARGAQDCSVRVDHEGVCGLSRVLLVLQGVLRGQSPPRTRPRSRMAHT